MNMKKLLYITAAALCLGAIVSCEDKREIVTLNETPTTFVLNTPAFADLEYDLDNSTQVVLTCSQPDFGFTAATSYTVQMSLENDFETEGKFETFAIPSTKARIVLPADEFAIKMTNLSGLEEADFPISVPVYIRAIAKLAKSDVQITSNTVTLNKVRTSYALPSLSLPEKVYVAGQNIGDAWNTWKPVYPIFDMAGEYYTMIYNGGGSENGFKWGEKAEDWFGYDDLKEIKDNAGAGVSKKDDGNILFAKAGWYVLHFEAKIVGQKIDYTLKVEPGKAYVIGNATGGWVDSDANWEMTPDKDGIFVSPAFTGSGELRAYIKVPGVDWWRTEFTLYNGTVFYRDVNIFNSWTEKGAGYSVSLEEGQKLYANFDANTGEVK